MRYYYLRTLPTQRVGWFWISSDSILPSTACIVSILPILSGNSFVDNKFLVMQVGRLDVKTGTMLEWSLNWNIGKASKNKQSQFGLTLPKLRETNCGAPTFVLILSPYSDCSASYPCILPACDVHIDSLIQELLDV